MAELKRYSSSGELIETVALDEEIFSGRVGQGLLHQVVVAYQANRRQGNASTKTRAEVRGGGAKPWRQKGTGRARASSIRSPLWRGGGVIFGPKPKDWSQKTSVRFRRLALLYAARSRANDAGFFSVEKIDGEVPSTKKFVMLLERMGVRDRVLVVNEGNNQVILRSARNVPGVRIVPASEVNAEDILKCEDIVFTDQSFAEFQRRLQHAATLESGDRRCMLKM